jgi:hypothetical protein
MSSAGSLRVFVQCIQTISVRKVSKSNNPLIQSTLNADNRIDLNNSLFYIVMNCLPIMLCTSPAKSLMARTSSLLRFLPCFTGSRTNTALRFLHRNGGIHFNPFSPFSMNLIHNGRQIRNILPSTSSNNT